MAHTPDALIVGGGVIGLGVALRLRQQGVAVTVLSRDFAEAASHMAAGMLAPGAEAIPPGDYETLCRRSLSLYGDWSQKLEALTGQPIGYWPSGILAPQYAPPANPNSQAGTWLDAATDRKSVV